MKPHAVLLTIALAFAAAVAGVAVGRLLVPAATPPGIDFHAVLHDELALDARQQRALDAIERSFAVRRRELEMQMRADNANLARAIAAEHGDGILVNAAVDRCHHTMGQLQKDTLAHVFAMRKTLSPDQAAIFDRAVVKALTDDAR
jgi:ATP-dependent DNA ligase